jgi:uncharacterized membrane protein
MDKTTRVYFPKWATILYSGLAVALIPWIYDLAQNLPARHLSNHWDAVWVGFDMMMLVAIVLTIWFVLRQRIWATMAASALATLFIVDAWFDILMSRPGREQRIALFFGISEVLLALLTYRLVFLAIHHSTSTKKFKLTTKKRK